MIKNFNDLSNLHHLPLIVFEACLNRKVFCFDLPPLRVSLCFRLPPLRVSLRFRLPIRRLFFGFMSKGFGHVVLRHCVWMFGFNFDFALDSVPRSAGFCFCIETIVTSASAIADRFLA